MKKIANIFLALTLICLSAGAQNAVMTGSFQFTSDSRRMGTIVLQSSVQRFEFPISDNVLIANLLPGRYTLDIEIRGASKGRRTTKLSQNIDIESERRTICRLNASGFLSFNKDFDRNSMPIFVNNFRDDRRDFDNRRDDPKVVVVQPPVPQPISEFDFNKLYNAVRIENFSDTKMRTLKTSSNFYQYFLSDQVKMLASLFTTDDDKLECAKYLVPKVLDVQNLPYIQEIFTFKSTKDEYLRFLNRM